MRQKYTRSETNTFGTGENAPKTKHLGRVDEFGPRQEFSFHTDNKEMTNGEGGMRPGG